jgi:sulfide:quinone oxidoreductase
MPPNQGSLFGVPIVAEKVRMLFERSRHRNADAYATLTPSTPGRKIATFTTADGAVEEEYDYLHVIPPQRAPEFVVQSGLHGPTAGPTRAGWRWTPPRCATCATQHLRARATCRRRAQGQDGGERSNGRCRWSRITSSPPSQGREGTATYNGYTSCPLITRIGRAMLIEFDYNNDLTPSFPGIIAPLEELWISWLMKEVALKATYNAMLRGMA